MQLGRLATPAQSSTPADRIDKRSLSLVPRGGTTGVLSLGRVQQTAFYKKTVALSNKLS